VLQVLPKVHSQKRAGKLLVCLVCLLQSFSNELTVGKSSFVEVDVNCVPAVEHQNVNISCARNFTKTSPS